MGLPRYTEKLLKTNGLVGKKHSFIFCCKNLKVKATPKAQAENLGQDGIVA